jgi:hypothetical protein
MVAGCGKEILYEFMARMINSIERKKIQQSEEFIINAISCATNLLFYDTPNSD